MASLPLSVSSPTATNPLCSSTLREAGLSCVTLARSLLSLYSVAASSRTLHTPLWPVSAPRPSAQSGTPAPPTHLPLRSGSPAPPPRRPRPPAGGGNPSRQPATRAVAHTACRTRRRTRPPDPAPTPRSRPDSPARTQAGQARGRGGATEGLARGDGGVGSIPTRFPCPPSIP